MDDLLAAIAGKKERLENLRPVSPKEIGNLEHYYDIEITYTSNALSSVETTPVIETGLPLAASPSKIIWKRSIITTQSAMCASLPGKQPRSLKATFAICTDW